MEMRISLCLVLCVCVCARLSQTGIGSERKSNLAVCFVCCDRACVCVCVRDTTAVDSIPSHLPLLSAVPGNTIRTLNTIQRNCTLSAPELIYSPATRMKGRRARRM